MLFEFVKEMPKPETTLRLDLSSLLGTLFFSWVILLLFPVSCKYLLFFFFIYLRIFKVHCLHTFIYDPGYFIDAGLRERTEIKNHDENAWTWGWAILAHYLCLLYCSFHSLHAMFCDFWFTYR